MTKWCTRCAAVRWTVLFLVVASLLAQTTESEQIFEETSFYTETTTEYPETNTAPNMEVPEDPRRNERMVVVYVKSNPEAETKNITQFLDSDDIVYTTADNETIIVTDSESGEDEVIHDDGDPMVMAGRSLNDNSTDKLPSEAGRPNPINREFNLKDVLNKWSTDSDFKLSDLLKVNLASLLADDYEEMNRLMKQNLVEDTDESMQGTMTDVLEPRDADDGNDQTVAASSEVVRQILPVPSTTLPRPILRSSGQIVPKYTYPLYSPVQRSDSAPSYIFLPRTTNGQSMAVLPTGNAIRLPMPIRTLPPTVAQRTQASTAAPSRLIRRPQLAASNETTARSPSRFGERFVSRLPRPFQYMLNMTAGGRHTTSEKPLQTFRPLTVSQSSAPLQSYPVRQRAPNRHFQRQTTRNNLPPPTRIHTVATTERGTTRLRVTTAAPSSNEFGARIRHFRYDGEKTSTNMTQNANKNKKVNREVKINHLRSNLVGKLVVMQSILDEKQEKSVYAAKQGGKLAATRLNRKGLPNGILKPIIPLRPRVNLETTTSSLTETVEVSVPSTTTEFGLKDKKKYRRPPSFRKGGSYKLSAEKQTEDPSNSAKLRESMVILQIVEATPFTSIANTTEKYLHVHSQQTLPLPSSVMPGLNETTTEMMNTTDTTTNATEDSTDGAVTTIAYEIAIEFVETSPAPNTTEATADLQEFTVQNATEDATPRDIVNNDEQTKLVDSSQTSVDLQATTSTTVENTTEPTIKTDKPSAPSSILEIVVTPVDPQESTTVETEENYRDAQSIKIDENKASTTISELVTLLKDTTLFEETATQSLMVASISTGAPEDDTSVKAIIERTNKDEESKASPNNQKIIDPEDEFLDAADTSDDESDFDFPDVESDSVIETNEENVSTSNKLSRFDRSVESASKQYSNKELNTLKLSQSQNNFLALNLARGVMRPINLPYNILPTREVAITR